VPTATQSADDGAHHVRHTGVNEPGDDNNRNRHGRRGATPATGVAAAADDNGRHGELEPGDDHGRHGEVEPGDDHGRHGEVEPGDDHGRHGELEPGDDHGGHGQEPGDDHGGDR
jgi:hypothetical protein